MDFVSIVNKIKKENLNKEEKNDLTSLKVNESNELELAECGFNDEEGYQIFTPKKIVKEMLETIKDDFLDSSKTILEPTSGDGAFTTYILEKRLENAYKKNSDNFELEALKCLATIYSIEMDNSLILKQRNNILTVFVKFAKQKKINFKEGYLDLVRCIIVKNFICAEFNRDENNEVSNPITLFDFSNEKPPFDVARKNGKSIKKFPVWNIESNKINYKTESFGT